MESPPPSRRSVLQFFPSPTILSARLHPAVLFDICDCFLRRPDQAERVIGTLLCCVAPDGTVEIKKTPMPSRTRRPPTRFATGFGVTGMSALVHDFYSKEVSNPIHLTVDTAFTNGEASIKAYVSVNLSLGDRQLAAQFQEIPLALKMIEAERVGFDLLKTTMVGKLPSDLEGMEASMERLYALINEVFKYVDDFVGEREKVNNDIEKSVADSLASVPKMPTAVFDKLFNDKIQDNLTLVYLTSLTKTQLSIAEKLNTSILKCLQIDASFRSYLSC